MADWSDRVAELRYEGEDVIESVPVGASHVVVTTHRVLAFTPDLAGENFRQVERPNVTDVAVTTTGKTRFLLTGLRAGLTGVVLVGIGSVVDFGALLGDIDLAETGAGAGQLGIGDILGMVQAMVSILSSLDEYMRLFGALLLLFALVPAAVYLYSRERRLVVSVAGGEDVHVATDPDDAETIVAALREAILPEDVRTGDRDRGSVDLLERFG